MKQETYIELPTGPNERTSFHPIHINEIRESSPSTFDQCLELYTESIALGTRRNVHMVLAAQWSVLYIRNLPHLGYVFHEIPRCRQRIQDLMAQGAAFLITFCCNDGVSSSPVNVQSFHRSGSSSIRSYDFIERDGSLVRHRSKSRIPELIEDCSSEVIDSGPPHHPIVKVRSRRIRSRYFVLKPLDSSLASERRLIGSGNSD